MFSERESSILYELKNFSDIKYFLHPDSPRMYAYQRVRNVSVSKSFAYVLNDPLPKKALVALKYLVMESF